MRDMQMVDMENIEIFKNHRTTLKETSKDSHNGADIFMTDSLLSVINFDAVKDEYAKPLKSSEMPKSNDALFFHDNGDIYFIEFKNGKIDQEKRFEIRLKIFDSLLMLTDIIEKGVSFTRKNLSYILVYNEEKNSPAEKTKSEMQTSPSRDAFSKHYIGKSGTNSNFIKFNLERFQKLYFKKVHTYTEEEFETQFISNLKSPECGRSSYTNDRIN
jgi:hypothetical protein